MADAPKTVPPEVIEALKRGDKLAAVKMLREGKVSSLKDVMQLLQSLQESGVLKEAMQQAKVNVKMSTVRSDALPPQVVDAIRSGNKIEAIRLLREATGVGLYEAKGTVESFDAANRIEAGQAPEPLIPYAAVKPGAASASAAKPHAPKPSAPMASPIVQPGLSPGEVPRTSFKSIGYVVVLVIAAILVWLALK